MAGPPERGPGAGSGRDRRTTRLEWQGARARSAIGRAGCYSPQDIVYSGERAALYWGCAARSGRPNCGSPAPARRVTFLRGAKRGAHLTKPKIGPRWGRPGQEVSPEQRDELREEYGIELDYRGYPRLAPFDNKEILSGAIKALGPCSQGTGSWVLDEIVYLVDEFQLAALLEITAPTIAGVGYTLAQRLRRLIALKQSEEEMDGRSLLMLEEAGMSERDARWFDLESSFLTALDSEIRQTKLAILALGRGAGRRGRPVFKPTAKFRLVAGCMAIAHFWNPRIIGRGDAPKQKASFPAFVSGVYGIATGKVNKDFDKIIRKCLKIYRNIELNSDNNIEPHNWIYLYCRLTGVKLVPAWQVWAAAAEELLPHQP